MLNEKIAASNEEINGLKTQIKLRASN